MAALGDGLLLLAPPVACTADLVWHIVKITIIDITKVFEALCVVIMS
jgi:hypothetical protein